MEYFKIDQIKDDEMGWTQARMETEKLICLNRKAEKEEVSWET